METNYLEVIPQEMIGEIIEYINDVNELNNLKQVSPYVSDAVNKYLRKFTWDYFDWTNIKNILISFNSLHKINQKFKIYIDTPGGGILIFENEKFSILLKNNDYTEFALNRDMIIINIMEDFPRLEYVSIYQINELKNNEPGISYLVPINKDLIDFCMNADFKDPQLNTLIKIVAAGRLMDHSMIISVLRIYLENNNLIVFTKKSEIIMDQTLLRYFGKYFDLPIIRWSDMFDLAKEIIKIDEYDFDLFEVPLWSQDNFNYLSNYYDKLWREFLRRVD